MSTNESKTNAWQDRIKERLKALDMTQDELARKSGVTRSAITHYLAGRRVPSLKQFQKIAEVLNTDPSWLQYGGTKTLDLNSLGLNTKELRDQFLSAFHKVPIVSWKQISYLKDIAAINANEVFAWVPHFYSDTPNSFAVVISNDVMTAPLGQKESFHEGEIIILDSKITPENGDFVLAIPINSSSAIFRQYVIDGDIIYLKPLNPQYPIVQVDDQTIICGVHTHTLCVGKRE